MKSSFSTAVFANNIFFIPGENYTWLFEGFSVCVHQNAVTVRLFIFLASPEEYLPKNSMQGGVGGGSTTE